jgi:hypothetical protein
MAGPEPMTTQREPKGSRLRLGSRVRLGLIGLGAGAALAAGLQGCGVFDHFSTSVPGLPEDGRWAQLPVGRWLMEPGVEVTGIAYCRAEICGQPGFVARLRVTGPDAPLARAIADQPEALLSRKPAPRWMGPARQVSRQGQRQTTPPAPGPTRITRASQGAWRGAEVELQPRSAKGKAAHVVVLAEPGTGQVLVTLSDTIEQARALSAAALR